MAINKSFPEGTEFEYRGTKYPVNKYHLIYTGSDFIDSHGVQIPRLLFKDNKDRIISAIPPKNTYMYNDNLPGTPGLMVDLEVNKPCYVYGYAFYNSNYNFIVPQGGWVVTTDELEQVSNRCENYEKELRALILTHVPGVLSTHLVEIIHSEDFKKSVAATKHHHAYKGGLLQHTYEVVLSAVELCNVYNADITTVVIASFLHDYGKVREYNQDGSRTVDGNKFGHIYMSLQKLEQLKPFFISDDMYSAVEHCILAHHGKLEWGSPVLPQTIEANIVHIADLLSSQINALVIKDGAFDDSYLRDR